MEYKKAQEVDPDKPSYVLNEAAALVMLEQYDDAFAACERSLKVSAKGFGNSKWKFKAYQRMGTISEKRGNADKAMEYYNAALLEENDVKLRDKLKKMKAVAKKQAEEAYLDPEKAVVHKEKGNQFFKDLKFKEAIAEYTEAIRRNPTDAKIYSNRAIAYCKLMTWSEALKDCDKAIAIDPTFVKPYIRKGKIQHVLKQYHKALEVYREAQKLEPDNTELKQAMIETQYAIQARNMSGNVDAEARQRAMDDPSVQAALNDPEVSSVLLQAQSGDTSILAKAMRDRPHIREKIETLIAAGVLRVG